MTPSSRQLLRVLGAAVVATSLGGAQTAAHAASGDLRVTSVDGGSARVVFTAEGLDGSAGPPQVAVRLDGERIPAEISGMTGLGPADVRRAVLLVDTSGSMRGAGISGAKRAASAFLSAVPTDVEVGVLTFDADVRVVAPPTRDRAVLRAAVDSLSADGATSLNDGVVAAVRTLGAAGTRRIVLLSDGADSASEVGLEAAVAAVQASGVEVSAVQFGTDASAQAALAHVTGAGRGSLLEAGDEAALADAFLQAAKGFTTELTIDAALPDGVAGRVLPLEVEVGVGEQRVVAEQRLEVPAEQPSAVTASEAAPLQEAWFGSADSLPWAGGALFVGLLSMLVTAVGVGDTRANDVRRTRKLLTRYTLRRHPAEVRRDNGALGDSAVVRSALELAGRMTERRGIAQRLTLALDRAALPFLPNEWVVLQMAGAALAAALVMVWSNIVLGLVLGTGLSLVVTHGYLSLRARRRQRAFLDSLPESLQLVAGGLSSGYSLLQALDAVVREGAEPIAGEIGRALAESRLGVDVEDALDAVGERMQCEDFSWVVMAIRVQREVGGNLAGVLLTVAATLRDRAKLRRQVRALSAEGRLSAWVLIALPILLGGFMFCFNNNYFLPMYTTPMGLAMLGGTAVSMTIGAVWMNKLVKVEV